MTFGIFVGGKLYRTYKTYLPAVKMLYRLGPRSQFARVRLMVRESDSQNWRPYAS